MTRLNVHLHELYTLYFHGLKISFCNIYPMYNPHFSLAPGIPTIQTNPTKSDIDHWWYDTGRQNQAYLLHGYKLQAYPVVTGKQMLSKQEHNM